MLVIVYFLVIVLANVLTAKFAPLELGVFIVPIGTFFIACTFFLRDFIQVQIGKRKTYYIIGLALVISAATSYLLGDTLWITFASALTFILSESMDTEVFSRYKESFSKRMLVSGLIGAFVDSVIFVVVGLSPLGANFIPWDFVYIAIVSQILAKYTIQFVVYFIVKGVRA